MSSWKAWRCYKCGGEPCELWTNGKIGPTLCPVEGDTDDKDADWREEDS